MLRSLQTLPTSPGAWPHSSGADPTSRSRAVRQTAPNVDFGSAYATGAVRAAVAVPLVKAGRLAAVFFLHFPVSHEWPAHEVALVEEVAERT